MVLEWLDKNWDKMLMVVITTGGMVWAAGKRFVGRIAAVESRAAALAARVERLQGELDAERLAKAEMEAELLSALDRVQDKLDDIINLRIMLERHDTLLHEIKEDVSEVRDEVKRLMRG